MINEKLEDGVMLECVISAPQERFEKLTFRLAIVTSTGIKRQIEESYKYVCVEDNNLYIHGLYSGGQTGNGVRFNDILRFDSKHNYDNKAFSRFIF